MPKTTIPAWECSKCGHRWAISLDQDGREIAPHQCRKCRSRLWNSGQKPEINPVGGVYGGRRVEPSAEQFKRFRKKARMTQPELADRLGISARQVRNIERGFSEPSLKTMSMFNAVYSRHTGNANG